MTYAIKRLRISLVAEGRGVRGLEKIEVPDAAVRAFKALCPNEDKEVLSVLLLDAGNAPLGVNVVSIGTLTASLVHPREVFRAAIVAGAAAIILGHNHPSGDTTPSKEDNETTRRMAEAGRIVGIPVLDHVVYDFGRDSYHSYRKAGGLYLDSSVVSDVHSRYAY